MPQFSITNREIKEEIARSEKDFLDAKHLRTVFESLDMQKIDKYKQLFRKEFGE